MPAVVAKNRGHLCGDLTSSFRDIRPAVPKDGVAVDRCRVVSTHVPPPVRGWMGRPTVEFDPGAVAVVVDVVVPAATPPAPRRLATGRGQAMCPLDIAEVPQFER